MGDQTGSGYAASHSSQPGGIWLISSANSESEQSSVSSRLRRARASRFGWSSIGDLWRFIVELSQTIPEMRVFHMEEFVSEPD